MAQDDKQTSDQLLLQNIIESIPMRVFWKDRESRYLGCNAQFAHDAGESSAGDVVGKTDYDLGWKEQAELYRADDHAVMFSGAARLSYEEPQTTPDGKTIWLRTSKVPLRDAEQEVIGVLGVYEDITEYHAAKAAAARLERALRLLSKCNMLLVHAEEESALLFDICRLAVDIGGYRMAWVGLAENDAGKTVRPVAQAGFEAGYLEQIRISWADNELGRGPTGMAIREHRPVVNQDMLHNPQMQPWREMAIQHGYQASIALPLIGKKGVMGALTIYSASPNEFAAEEVALLTELAGDLAFGIETLRIRAEHAATEKRLEFLANHDPLTGLPNLLLLKDRFERAQKSAARERAKVAFLNLDLDNFKHVNDGFGREAGDVLLVRIVERLLTCVRGTDTLSRHGGDEFIILLTGLHKPDAVEGVAQNVLDAFAEPFEIDGRAIHITCSIGISLCPEDGRDFEVLSRKADIALYQAKDAGRNTYRFYDEQMNIDALEHIQLQNQLRSAYKNREFELLYQPQIELSSERVIGVEALLRWQHPDHGTIMPTKFIPLTERSGLIIPIGEWVIQEACRQAKRWQEEYDLPPITMAVNLSALQFRRGNIVETVTNALNASGLPASQLELELTESILLHDVEAVINTMRELKKIGVKLSIDDFGTGYSSLSYLKKLAVDKLKLDQSFVRDMLDNQEDAAIVRAIIQLGHTLQLSVIAEGVENEQQLNLLKRYGCEEVQGYWFSRPLSAKNFAELALKHCRK